MPSAFPTVIVQARTGSTRLPGKIGMMVEGRTIIELFLERVGRMEAIGGIVVATTANAADDTLVDIVHRFDGTIKIFRGSESDVLDRFYQAAMAHRLEHIVRITPDCPLIDPAVSDSVVKKYLGMGVDYCSNNMPRTFPHGLDTEVFSIAALERAWLEATNPREREHVTPYIREHPNLFTQYNLRNSEDLGHLRWTLDYQEDLIFVREVYRRLYPQNRNFSMEDVLSLLRAEPSISEINKQRGV